MQRARGNSVGTSASKATSIETVQSNPEEVTDRDQQLNGHRNVSAENTIAKYGSMAIKSFKINPTDYSHNWYAS